jgi:hypothetical protein
MPKQERRPSARLTARLTLCCAALLLTQACSDSHPQTAGTSAPANIGCLEFDRLTFSRLHDTEPTIAGIKAYDVARDRVCGVGK